MRYRRPTGRTIGLAAVLAATASLLVALSRPIDIVVDGQTIEADVPPVSTSGNHVYVPVRSFADALGAQTIVDGPNIDVVRGDQSLHLRVGDVHAKMDGMPLTLQAAPFRVRGRVMVGLAPIARAFAVHASYDAHTARIDVMTPGIGEAATGSQPQAQ